MLGLATSITTLSTTVATLTSDVALKAYKTYVDSQDAGLQSQISTHSVNLYEKPVTTTDNWDDLISTGTYVKTNNSGSTNSPVPGYNFLTVKVINSGSGTIKQIVFDSINNNIYIRTFYGGSGVWTAWRTLLDDADYTALDTYIDTRRTQDCKVRLPHFRQVSKRGATCMARRNIIKWGNGGCESEKKHYWPNRIKFDLAVPANTADIFQLPSGFYNATKAIQQVMYFYQPTATDSGQVIRQASILTNGRLSYGFGIDGGGFPPAGTMIGNWVYSPD